MTNKTNIGLFALTLFAVTMTTGNLAFAEDLNEGVVDPGSKLYDKYTDKWWQWITSIPTAQNPANIGLEEIDCTINQSDKVWFLSGIGVQIDPETGADPGGIVERDCSIPVGTKIMLPIVNLSGTWATPLPEVECTTDEEGNPLDWGAECYNDQLTFIADFATDFQVIVDGVPLQDLDQYRFKESQAFGIDCQAVDLLCSESDEYAVHEGYFVMLTPLPPGEHVVEFGGTFPDFEFQTGATYNITITN